MEQLQQLLLDKDKVTTIDLEFAELDSLDSILPYLIQFPYLYELNLFGNRLHQLPEDLSQLTSLQKLDISNNIITDVRSVIKSLQSLQNLTDLTITLENDKDRELLVQNLRNVIILNGQQVSATQEHQISERDLSVIAQIYDRIREQWRKLNPQYDSIMAQEFDQNISQIMNQLSQKLETSDDFQSNCQYLISKHQLFISCHQKISLLVQQSQQDWALILNTIAQQQEEIVNNLAKLMQDQQLHYENKIKNIQQDLSQAMSENDQLLEAAEQLESQIKLLKQNPNQVYLRELQDKIDDMQQELDEAKSENKKYLSIIINKTKDGADFHLNQFNSEEKKSCFADIVGKELSLKRLKDTIQEIVKSKVEYDLQCNQDLLPYETMEQFMYNFLMKKYGLRNLVVEWGASIIKSVRKYRDQDALVNAFCKVLQNQCDESIFLILDNVRNAAIEFLNAQLQQDFPLKSQGEITQMLQFKINGNLDESDWRPIIQYLYLENDQHNLIQQIQNNLLQPEALKLDRRQKLTRSQQKQKELENYSSVQGKIKFADFINILQNHQAELRTQSIRPFFQKFNGIDTEKNGYLNENQFKQLLLKLDVDETDIEELFLAIDPNNTKKFTFNGCVGLFQSKIFS